MSKVERCPISDGDTDDHEDARSGQRAAAAAGARSPAHEATGDRAAALSGRPALQGHAPDYRSAAPADPSHLADGTMNYEGIFRHQLHDLHREGNYRVFCISSATPAISRTRPASATAAARP